MRSLYPVTQFKKRHIPKRCYDGGEKLLVDPECSAVAAEETPAMAPASRDSVPLPLCPLLQPPPPPPTVDLGRQPLNCSSPPAAIEARAVLLVGVPSSPSPKGRQRRDAIRAAWMRDPLVGSEVVVCFLLSAATPAPALGEIEAERAAHGDVLLLEAPETPWLIRRPTRYSNFSKRGRGMPTFKQYAFFQHAAARLPRVPFIAKFDDDTAPNVRLLVPFLRRLLCARQNHPFLFVGAINWAAVVPRAMPEGVRADRCGFAWNMVGALQNMGRSWGTRGVRRGPGKFQEACDARGAVLPVPYAAGAGYIFSAPLLRWVATSDAVVQWVDEARDPSSREELQWQKFEDTSTGYWLSYAPQTVHYVDIGTLVHDIDCHPEGRLLRDGEGTYRPPANTSLLVHNLKTPSAFGYAHEHMRGGTVPYSQNRCMHGVHGAPLLDEATIQARELQRSRTLWAAAAAGDVERLVQAHHVHLRTALRVANVAPCAKCRKRVVAERMVQAATKAACQTTPRAALMKCAERVRALEAE